MSGGTKVVWQNQMLKSIFVRGIVKEYEKIIKRDKELPNYQNILVFISVRLEVICKDSAMNFGKLFLHFNP